MKKLISLIILLIQISSLNANDSKCITKMDYANKTKVPCVLDDKPRKNVLVIHSYHETSSRVKNIQKAINKTINKEKFLINMYIENMDTNRFSSKEYYEYLKSLYKLKYKNIKLDVIISSDNNAFNFLKNNRNELFGNIPVSFCEVNSLKESQLNNNINYTGVAENEDFHSNIKLMKKINPNLKKVYILLDYSSSGNFIRNKIKKLIQKNNYKLEFIFNKNKSFPYILNDIMKLEKNSAVLYGIYFKDAIGKYLSPSFTSNAIKKISKVPIYTMFDLFLKNGVLGGNMINSYSQGKIATNIANKLLQGYNAKNIPIVSTGSNQNIFDFKAMSKFDIVESDLPKNSIILNKNIQLFSNTELDWILKNPEVFVGGEMDWKPFDFVNKYGDYEGITNDILNLVSKKSGLNFNMKTNLSWDNLLKEFKKGNIDILPAIYYSKTMDSFGNFTKPYIGIQEELFVLKNSNFKSEKDLANSTIAASKNFEKLKSITKDFPNITIIKVANINEAIQALKSKKVDAFIGGKIIVSHLLKQNKTNDITNLSQTLINPQELRMLVQKNKKYLYRIIQKSLKGISEKEILEIKKRWSKNKIFLTKEEKQWVKQHKTLKIAIDPNFLPFSAYIKKESNSDLGQGFHGMSIDIIKKALKSVGMKAEFIKTNSWSESLKEIKAGTVDALTSAAVTEERKKFLKFTNVTIRAPRVIAVHKDTTNIHTLEDLKNKKIGLIKDGVIATRVIASVNTANVVWYTTIQDALSDLSNKKIDAFIDSFYVIAYIMNEEGFHNIELVNKFDKKNKLHIALNKNNISNIGLKVLNKGLSSITKAQKSEITKRWSSITLNETVNYTLLFQVIAVFILLLLIGLYWGRKISIAKKEAQEAHDYANSIMNSQENFVITTAGTEIRTANKAFLEFYNVSDVYEFMNKFGTCICDTFETKYTKGFIRKKMDDKTWVEYIIDNPDLTHKTIITFNQNTYIFKITLDEIVFKNEKLKTAVFTDITIMENAKKDIEQILSNILLPVLITSKEKRKIIYANKYAQQQYEKPVEEIIGSSIDSIYVETSDIKKIADEILKNGFIENAEYQFKTFKENIFDALLSVSAIRYKDEDCYISMVTDITHQKKMENEVRALHKHTRDSIEYASHIQGALIPDDKLLNTYFKDNFVHWMPKDTVGGDIWLFNTLRHKDECLLFFIDCTGHGVPGAFVTMIVKSIEREVVTSLKKHPELDISPAIIMGHFNRTMKVLLKQETKDSKSNAGWDGGIVYYNKRKQILKFAGAETPLFYLDENGEFNTIKGNRYSVGYKKCDMSYEYKEHIIEVKEGMKFYCTTDGYLDQNGGEKDFPFGKKRFSKIIKDNHTKPMNKQKEIFISEMNKYESMIENNDRNDDMTLIAFEIENYVEDEYIIKHDGEINQELITNTISIIEDKVTNINLLSKVSIATIELMQNMMNYSKSIEEDTTNIIAKGLIEVTKDSKNNYFINSKNIISKQDKHKIEPKLLEIQSLDLDGIKKKYRELRKSGQDTHEKGGGIGFYEIAKLSKYINFEFKAINSDKYYFKFQIEIERRLKERKK